ncbi:MAG: porin [Pirellulales bacterium]
MSRSTRARNGTWPRLLCGALAALLALCCPLVGAGQEVPERKTASQIYFETLGSLAPATDDDKGFPRVWDLGRGRTIQLRGRIDLDSLWTAQSAGNVLAYGDLGDVVGLRRARIGAQGDLGDGRRYELEIDMAMGTVVPRDVFIGFGQPNQGGERRFGHFREPFSLEANTSANYYMFMERSPVNDLDPARAWGLCLFRCNAGETTTLAVGLFHNGSDGSDFEAGDGADAALTARLTAAPILENDGEELLHVGLAISERFPENNVVIINQHPRAQLLDPSDSTLSPFVPEIEIPADFQQLFNLQLATNNGPFWTQSEWYGTIIPQFGSGPLFFRGFYVSCGYFLTGEHHEYEKETGVLGPVTVNRPLLHGCFGRDRPHGWGAWELTARFSYLDYFDADLSPGPAGQNIGIRLPQATFGVNWYWADRMRLMFNYSYEAPDESNLGTTDASVFGTRLNVFW